MMPWCCVCGWESVINDQRNPSLITALFIDARFSTESTFRETRCCWGHYKVVSKSCIFWPNIRSPEWFAIFASSVVILHCAGHIMGLHYLAGPQLANIITHYDTLAGITSSLSSPSHPGVMQQSNGLAPINFLTNMGNLGGKYPNLKHFFGIV